MTPPSPAPGPGPEAVYAGRVMHQRLRPQRHRLQYRMFSLLLDLQPQRLEALHRRLRWLSVNRFNLFSFHERDHGDGRARGLADWVQQQLRACGQPPASEIRLLAMPRVLGYGFNPLSLFFCHGADGTGGIGTGSYLQVALPFVLYIQVDEQSTGADQRR